MQQVQYLQHDENGDLQRLEKRERELSNRVQELMMELSLQVRIATYNSHKIAVI
jgi:hypothetical protein